MTTANEKEAALGGVNTTHHTAAQQIAAITHAHSAVDLENAALRTRIVELEADGRRLDWLDSVWDDIALLESLIHQSSANEKTRAAIDAAMEGGK